MLQNGRRRDATQCDRRDEGVRQFGMFHKAGTGMRRACLLLALVVCCGAGFPASAAGAPPSASGDGAAEAASPREEGGFRDFLDKWIINGGSIGGAAGATIGQIIGSALLGGPAGMIVGSVVGNLVGGVAGTLIDNSINKAYNYASFDRPPLGRGGMVLKDAGEWEQFFYQIDQWAISGGGILSYIAHFGVNLLGPLVPGPIGAFLSSYLGIFVADAVIGTIGDDIDALIDGGDLGAFMDRRLESGSGAAEQDEEPTDDDTEAPSMRTGGTDADDGDPLARRRERDRLLEEMKEGIATKLSPRKLKAMWESFKEANGKLFRSIRRKFGAGDQDGPER